MLHQSLFSRLRVGTIVLSLVAAAASYAQPSSTTSHDPSTASPTSVAAMDNALKGQLLDKINEIVEKDAYVPGVDFSKWPQFLASQQSEITKADNPGDFAMAINRALHQFGLSHIVLITPEASKARLTKQSVGIGVQIQPEQDGIRIVNVFTDTPAEEAGLHAGDLVILCDGKKPQSPVDMLGEAGSVAKIRVKHLNGKVEDYALTRRAYSNIRPETLTWVSKDTAVLKVFTFDVGYNRDNVERLMRQAAPAKNLIVDLRSNPGGSILNLTHLMGLLLPPGTELGTFISRYTVDKYVKEEKGNPTDLTAIAKWSPSKLRAAKDSLPSFKGHVAVLVNGGSGSASEIAAAALRDQIAAPIVGTRSAGAVLVSVMTPLPEGFVLQYPITDFITVDGVRLEGTGVTPVVETAGAFKYNEPDEAVEKAALLLERADLRDERVSGG